jgi:hypothetical protein
LEETKPDELEDDTEDSDDHGPYIYDNPAIGALASVHPVGSDMSIKVMSEDPDTPTVVGVKLKRLSPDMLRAWRIMKARGAISLRAAHNDPRIYVAMLELHEAGLLKKNSD